MLRKINPIDILNQYMNGSFKALTMPKTEIVLSTGGVNVGNTVGTNYSSQVYRINDRSTNGYVIATTNQLAFDKTKCQVICPYCKRRDLDINKTIGIPVKMTVHQKTNVATYFTDGTYCHFGCAYSDLKRSLSTSRMYRDPLYMDSEQLLHSMYYRMYPSKKGHRINAAPDYRLLDENGGPLSSQQFDTESVKYMLVPNIAISPIKKQYLKLNVK